MHTRRLLSFALLCLALLFGRPAGAQDDSWLGQFVFYKTDAVAKVEDTVIDLELLAFPAEVKEVKGEWLWLGRAWVNKSQCMLQDAALEYYSEAVRRTPSSSDAMRRRAMCHWNAGNEEQAKKDIDEAIRLDPKDARAYNNRGVMRFESAMGSIVGRALKPGMAALGGALGQALGGAAPPPDAKPAFEPKATTEESALFAEAIRDFDTAIGLNPKLASAYCNRGLAKGEREDLPGAMRDFDDAIRLDPKNEEAYGYRALAKLETKDYAGAIRDFDEAIRLDPKDTLSYRDRAGAKEQLKDYAGAVRDYDEIVKIDPEDSFSIHARGEAKAGQKDYQEAMKDFDEAIRLGGASDLAQISKIILLSTAADATIRKPAEALKLAEELVLTLPINSEALSAKACALAANGKFTEAIEVEKSAAEDKNWVKDESSLGGAKSEARINAWKAGRLWHP